MKISRLLTYAVTGIITGLLIENQALIIRQSAAAKARKLKKSVNGR